MRSPMQHQFSVIPDVKIQRSKFDRSHSYKSTFNAGYLVPVLVDEVLPGDSINLTMTSFARLATPLKPIMDNMYLDSFFSSCHGVSSGTTSRSSWVSNVIRAIRRISLFRR